ncbi:MAG TPA: hypothetical protein PLX04_08940 [Caldisericia bacterium]|nr:hypothetical protein [Caldisericia bacterium]
MKKIRGQTMAQRQGTLGIEQSSCCWYVTLRKSDGSKAYPRGPFDTKEEAIEARIALAKEANKKRRSKTCRTRDTVA